MFQIGNGAPPGSTLIHYQQIQSDSAVAGQSASVSGLQVVTSSSQATNLAIHQQILIQSRQMRKFLPEISKEN